MKSKDLTSGISSLGLVDGDMQLDWLGSEKSGESSPEARRASLLAAPESGRATPTSDTLPQSGLSWSQPSGLLGFLESRLQPQSKKTTGSMIYSMHWKQKITPRGRSYFQLVASGRRTSDSDSGLWHGWVTASSRDWKDTAGMATEAQNPDGTSRQRVDQLPRQAQMTGWQTQWRPVESGTFPLADGIPARVGRLRAYGNAIVPQAAAEVMIAAMEPKDDK